jgi:hypothetical protein
MAPLYLKMTKKAARLAAFATVLLAGQAFAQQGAGITFFPPEACQPGQLSLTSWDGINNTKCLPMPSCPSQMLTFDGASFTCVQVPTCKAGEMLSYSGTSFSCINVATAMTAAQAAIDACTSTTQTNIQSCPAGQSGQISTQVTTNSCDGSVTTTPINNCLVNLAITVAGFQCSPGSTVSGQFINGVLNPCTGGSCQNYTCTATGLVPQ